MASDRILFVTGRLAEQALTKMLAGLSDELNFSYEIKVLGISVAALMHADWVSQRLEVKDKFDRIVLPGWCGGDTEQLSVQYGTGVERGPKDLRNLPEFLCGRSDPSPDLSSYDVEILAEINHAPLLTDSEIVSAAEKYRDAGADIIDLGCVPGESWDRVGDVTRILCECGFRVSIDSFDRREVESAVAHGAELVLSCNGSNIEWLKPLGAEVVVIPDQVRDMSSLRESVRELEDAGVPFRIDPVLEPIGFGFAESLSRYFEVRRHWPAAQLMMGIGNLTELTEVDTAGINVLLAGICQELQINSVLTTEVINWAGSAVHEFDLARRLVKHSVSKGVLPKHVDSQLVMLRDPKLLEMGEDALDDLARRLKDPNFRIFVERGEIHVMNRDGYWRGSDAYDLFAKIIADSPIDDQSHAFYLGYEFAKAVTALTLGKQYMQDEALSWGFLTVPEKSIRDRRQKDPDVS